MHWIDPIEVSMHRRRRPSSTVVAVVAVVAAGFGCVAPPPDELALGGGVPGGGGGGDTQDGPVASAEQRFRALEADFVSACGKCHVEEGGIGPAFLAPPDRYVSIVGWPGIVVVDATKSVLLTHPMSGVGHPGNNLDDGELEHDLLPRIQDWLEAEEEGLVVKHSMLGPFEVSPGFNAVGFAPLGEGFEGMALSFETAELGGSVLDLEQVSVHTSPTMGVHIAHPLFAVVGVDGRPDPDPIDSYSNFEATYEAKQGGQFDPPTLILGNWIPGARMSIAFEVIEAVPPEP